MFLACGDCDAATITGFDFGDGTNSVIGMDESSSNGFWDVHGSESSDELQAEGSNSDLTFAPVR